MSDDSKGRREELRRQYEEFYGDGRAPTSELAEAAFQYVVETHADTLNGLAVHDSAGSMTGTYPDGYLEELREDWDD